MAMPLVWLILLNISVISCIVGYLIMYVYLVSIS